MGVAGLTGYVNKNLKGAVAMEDLRRVRSSAWVVKEMRRGELRGCRACCCDEIQQHALVKYTAS